MYICPMKRIGIYISVFLLAFLVLLGSGGFTVGKMICGGNECASTYSLGFAKDCCSNNSSTEKVKSCCCELINVSYALDDFSVSEKTNISAQQLNFVFLSLVPSFELHSCITHFPLTDPSPPDPQDYLHLIGSLLL